jgi:hypothetical protein
MKLLPLFGGRFAIVNNRDFRRLSKFRWHLAPRKKNTYAARKRSRTLGAGTIYLHQEVLGPLAEGRTVDHKNGNGLDCRRRNLRVLTNRQNLRSFHHTRDNKTSKYRGVTWLKANRKWQAQITCRPTNFYIGSFQLEVEAAKAWDRRAIQLGFSKEALNFP